MTEIISLLIIFIAITVFNMWVAFIGMPLRQDKWIPPEAPGRIDPNAFGDRADVWNVYLREILKNKERNN